MANPFARFFRKDPVEDINISSSGVTFWRNDQPLNDNLNFLDQFQDWTYRASKTKADSIIPHPQKLYQIKGDEREEIKFDSKTPAAQLLNDLKAFNPYQTLDQARQLTQLHLSLTGTAFWLLTESDTKTQKVEFYLLNPTKVQVVSNKHGLPSHYKYTEPSGSSKRIEVDNLIVFLEPNPKDWQTGYGPLQASLFAHNSYEYAMRFNMSTFFNSGRPEGFLSVEGADQVQVDKMEETLYRKYSGTNNARKIGVTNKLLKFIGVTTTQKDLDFIKGLDKMRDEILSIHGVPKTLVGIDNTTYNNAQEATKVFQRQTLLPILTQERSIYNEQLIPKYFKTVAPRDIAFDFDNPVQIDKKENAEQSSMLFEKQIITLDEARNINGFNPATEGGDEYFEPFPTFVDNSGDLKALEEKVERKVEKVAEKISKIPSIKEVREEAWEKLRDQLHDKSISDEKEYKKEAAKYLIGQRDRVIADLEGKKAVNLSTDLSIDNEIEIALKELSPTYQALADASNELANELTGGDVDVRKELRKKIEKNLALSYKEINEVTRKDLVELLAEAIENDLGVDDTSKLITELYNGYIKGEGDKGSRLDTISRTEVGRVKNSSTRDNYFRNEFVESIQWITARDSFVRGASGGDQYDHISADGQTVKRGRKFIVSGEPLAYPGDPSGSAGNTINCRCNTVPVIK